jgi:hypothetical protein
MSLSISVPLNTMLADLDESLRLLLRDELSQHGFEGISIAFDAPTKEWATRLSAPTVNLFLYDLREARELRQREWQEHRANGAARVERPPLRVDCTYAVTAWARAVEDEHRILSHVLAVLYAHEVLTADELSGTLGDPAAQRFPIATRVGEAKGEDKADFWNAVGGTFRVAVDYIVTLACEPGVVFERGPQVRTTTLRLGRSDRGGARSGMEEYHQAGGVITDASGAPAEGVWVALPEIGAFDETDASGRFRFTRVPAGIHRVLARGRDGAEVAGQLTVPGAGAELKVPASAAAD